VSEDTQVRPLTLSEAYWLAHVAGFKGQEEFFAPYGELGGEYRSAVDAGVKAVADMVRAQVAGPLEAMLAGWRKTLLALETTPAHEDDGRGARMAARAEADMLRTLIRQAEEAVNAALKGAA
jgi:hypothetical protein